MCAEGERAMPAGAWRGLERVICTEEVVRDGVGVMETAWPLGARIWMAADGRAGVMVMLVLAESAVPSALAEAARQRVITGSDPSVQIHI